MKLKPLIAGAVMAIATPLAMAEGSGLYVALDVGQSKFKDLCSGFTGGSCKDTDTAFRGALGYQINKYVGVEGGYVDAGKSTATSPGFSGEAKLTDWQLVGVGTLPLGDGRFSLFAKAGADRWSSKITANGAAFASGSGTSFLWGAGAEFDFTKSLGVRAQYETRKAGDINKPEGLGNVSMLSAGVVYRF